MNTQKIFISKLFTPIFLVVFAVILFITQKYISNLNQVIAWVLVVLSVGLVILDVYLYENDTDNDTISNVIRDMVNKKAWFLIFAWGVLAGHFFLGDISYTIIEDWIVFGGLFFLLLVQYILGQKKPSISITWKLLILVSGVLYGHFIWSQAECLCKI